MQVDNPEMIARRYKTLLFKRQEHTYATLLDVKNKIKKELLLGVGGWDATLIDVRVLFQAALLNSASKIILVHNHPSGDPSPSKEDIETTLKISKAGEFLDIRLIDHIIIGQMGFVSMKECGII